MKEIGKDLFLVEDSTVKNLFKSFGKNQHVLKDAETLYLYRSTMIVSWTYLVGPWLYGLNFENREINSERLFMVCQLCASLASWTY